MINDFNAIWNAPIKNLPVNANEYDSGAALDSGKLSDHMGHRGLVNSETVTAALCWSGMAHMTVC
jgi:hypothetical protein